MTNVKRASSHWLRLLILLLIIMSGCSPSGEIKTGTYKYYQIPRIEFLFRYSFQDVHGFRCGVKELTLNNDSTFIYDLHSEIFTGKWKLAKGKLSLVFTQMEYVDEDRKKEMMGKPCHLPGQPFVYNINHDNLVRIINVSKYNIIEKLKFVKNDSILR